MIIKALTAVTMLGLGPMFALSLRRCLRDGRVVIRGQTYTRETRPLTYWSNVVTDALGVIVSIGFLLILAIDALSS